MKLQHLKAYYNNAKYRAIRENVPFSIVLQDLIDIATDECPIFHTPFVWGASGLGKGKVREDTPQLDRIIPEIGYVKGNIAFLSGKANKMKDNGTMQEHYDIADWIWNQTHAKQKSTTFVSEGTYIQGAVGAELGSVSTPWTWEDDNNADDYRGATQGENSYRSAKEGGGDSLGRRGQKVVTLEPLTRIEDHGQPDAEIVRLEFGSRYLPDKP